MEQSTTEAARRRRERLGFLSGVFMALGASLGFAAARAGIVGGLLPIDLIFVRFIVAAAIMLPVWIRFGLRGFAGIGWKRSLVLTVLGGAPFAMLQTERLRLRPARPWRGDRTGNRDHRQHHRRGAVPARAARPQSSYWRGRRAGGRPADRLGRAARRKRTEGVAGRSPVLCLERAVGVLHALAASLARARVARHGGRRRPVVP